MKRMYLVRHAPADWPETEPRYRGSSDAPLSGPGRAEAGLLARRFGENVRSIYTSDFARAAQTADAISLATNARVRVVGGLGEMDFGEWEGRSHAEIFASGCPTYRAWLLEPFTVAPPDGEGFPGFSERVKEAFRCVMDEESEEGNGGDDGDIVLVGHGGSLRVILAHLLGMPDEMHFRLRVDHSSLSIVEWSGSVPILVTLNDVSHLSGGDGP